MKVKPMLGDWEIPHIEAIGSLERRELVELAVPGRAANLYQDLNAAPTQVVISGSLYGDEDRDAFLDEVRGKFKAGEPVTFVADIVTATEVQYVLIDTLRFEQNAARPDEISYLISVRESPPPPPASNPLGDLDTGILDDAGAFMDTVSGALDAIETLGNVPDFGNPLPPLQGSLGDIGATVGPLGESVGGLKTLFGIGA